MLKLEITICNALLQTEIKSCCNFLQRKRNLNLTFDILIKSTRLFEIRRLICESLLKKEQRVKIENSETGGLYIELFDNKLQKKYLEMHWTIAWSVDFYEISDLVEFFCNKSDLGEKYPKLKGYLHTLTEAQFDFHLKLKIWKQILQELYGKIRWSSQYSKSKEILEISDSDDDKSIMEVNNSTNENDEIVVIE